MDIGRDYLPETLCDLEIVDEIVSETAAFPDGVVCEKPQKLADVLESEYEIREVDRKLVAETELSLIAASLPEPLPESRRPEDYNILILMSSGKPFGDISMILPHLESHTDMLDTVSGTYHSEGKVSEDSSIDSYLEKLHIHEMKPDTMHDKSEVFAEIVSCIPEEDQETAAPVEKVAFEVVCSVLSAVAESGPAVAQQKLTFAELSAEQAMELDYTSEQSLAVSDISLEQPVCRDDSVVDTVHFELQKTKAEEKVSPAADLELLLEPFEPFEHELLPSSDVAEEISREVSQPKRPITTEKKYITKILRSVAPDGEILETVIREEAIVSDVAEGYSPRSSVSESPDKSELCLTEFEQEAATISVYTDTVEDEPKFETELTEYEDTLPDGTTVHRKIVQTRQKQTVTKKVVLEGPEEDLNVLDLSSHFGISQSESESPQFSRYSARSYEEPQLTQDVQFSEEAQSDGTVVRKRISKTVEQQLLTERMVFSMHGPFDDVHGEEEISEMLKSLEAAKDVETLPTEIQFPKIPQERMKSEAEKDEKLLSEGETDANIYKTDAADDHVSTSSSEMAQLEDVCLSQELDHEVELDKNSQGTDVEEPFSPTRETFGIDCERSTYLSKGSSAYAKPTPSELSEATTSKAISEMFQELEALPEEQTVVQTGDLIDFSDSSADKQIEVVEVEPTEYQQLETTRSLSQDPAFCFYEEDLPIAGSQEQQVHHSSSGKAALDSDATYRFFVGPVLQDNPDDVADDSILQPAYEQEYQDLCVQLEEPSDSEMDQIILSQMDAFSQIKEKESQEVLEEFFSAPALDTDLSEYFTDQDMKEKIQDAAEIPEITVTQCQYEKIEEFVETTVEEYESEDAPEQDQTHPKDESMVTSLEFDEEVIEVIESVYERSDMPDTTTQIHPRESKPSTFVTEIELAFTPASKEDKSGHKTDQSTPVRVTKPVGEVASPDLISESDSEVTSSIEGTIVCTEASAGIVETADLLGLDDQGDTSSVESFPTVVPQQEDVDEDRLADIASDIASLTSSFHSEASGYDVQLEQLAHIDDIDKDESNKILDELEIEFPCPAISLETSSEAKLVGSQDDSEDPDNLCLTSTVLDAIKEEEEKVSGSQKTTSSSDKLDTDTTTSDSSKLLGSSPDAALSLRFHSKSAEKDDISVSSSLLEFEHLEREILEKGSIESVTVATDSSHSAHGRHLEKDNISVSSSLAEFERLEKELLGHSDSLDLAGAESKSGSSSVSEFERISSEFPGDSEHTALSAGSLRSSSSSLSEFERLERQLRIDEELEAEAKKVASLLEQGSLPLMKDQSESDTSSDKDAQQAEVSLAHKPTQVLPEETSAAAPDTNIAVDYPPYQDIVQIIREASKNVEMFEFEDTQKEISQSHMAASVIETSATVVPIVSIPDFDWSKLEIDQESTGQTEFQKSIFGDAETYLPDKQVEVHEEHASGIAEQEYAAKVVDDEGMTDSLDEEASTDDAVVTERTIEAGLKEKEARDIDADSLQDTESHHSYVIDSDSLHDPDSLMQMSTESCELESASSIAQTISPRQMKSPEMLYAAASDFGDPMLMSSDSLLIHSFDIIESSCDTMEQSGDSLALEGAMAASADSLDLECKDAMEKMGDIMERSTDSLETDNRTVPESQSCESFETDSLQGEHTIVTTSMSQDSLKEVPLSAMDMSVESGAWSQSSFSSATLVSSGRDIMQMSLDSQAQDKTSSTDTSPQTTTSEGRQLEESGSDTTPTSWHESFTVPSLSTDNLSTQTSAIFDTEGNLMPREKDQKTGVDDEGNMQSVRPRSADTQQLPKDSESSEMAATSVLKDTLPSYGPSATSVPIDSCYCGPHYESDASQGQGSAEAEAQYQPGGLAAKESYDDDWELVGEEEIEQTRYSMEDDQQK